MSHSRFQARPRTTHTSAGGLTPMLWLTTVVVLASGCGSSTSDSGSQRKDVVKGPIYVQAGEDLQAAADSAARAESDRRLILRPGIYRPRFPMFCLLALTAKHDGITIEGMDEAIICGRATDTPHIPLLSHAIYCGHGITEKTQIRNLVITESGGHVTRTGIPIEDAPGAENLNRGMFFHLDGGAIKVFGRSSPVFRNITFRRNQTKLCGGAVSIEQQGIESPPPTFVDCRFVENECPATGSAIDVLEGSSVVIQNCYFESNIGNSGMADVKLEFGLSYNEKHGSGALTVFPGSTAEVSSCTFIANWNAVDDHGQGSRYRNCLFVSNDQHDGSRQGAPYEVDITDGANVTNCVFFASLPDLNENISRERNVFLSEAPLLDAAKVPIATEFNTIGYRP